MRRVARGLGIPVNAIFAATFAFGSGLAGLGGALGADLLGLDPTFPLKFMLYFLIVVTVGGTSSLTGPFLAALLIGVADVAGKYYVPWFGAFIIYVLMMAILVLAAAGPVRAGDRMTRDTDDDVARKRRSSDRRCRAGARWHRRRCVFWLAALALLFVAPRHHLMLNEIAILALFALSLDLHPRLCRHRLARARRFPRPRRLRGRPVRQTRQCRSAGGPRRRGRRERARSGS